MKEAVEAITRLQKNLTEENLWQTMILFQDYPFYTVSGLPFTYKIKVGRRGEYTHELMINRREKSKTLTWSSVLLAFRKAMEKRGMVIARPKELVDCRGVSYSFSIFWEFGLIMIPEELENKMEAYHMAGRERIRGIAAENGQIEPGVL